MGRRHVEPAFISGIRADHIGSEPANVHLRIVEAGRESSGRVRVSVCAVRPEDRFIPIGASRYVGPAQDHPSLQQLALEHRVMYYDELLKLVSK
jgi:hypothetical protein